MMLGGELAALFACAAATALNLVAHLVAYRLTGRYVRSAIVGFAAGLIVLAICEVLRFTAPPVGLMEGLVSLAGDLAIYGCAAFLFFNFINAGESSIRLRILRELRGMERPLTVTAL